ncbi:glycosyltransferase [Gordonia hankookensis]|uniref:Glycosyltransferase n=2 Tax=Gordonia hankookensis TaxID=589403 RepID=A0ABR7WBD9_9ACTN|nr:glycosyltransferase family 2 protein [Gordonia hankookensis]MBD1320123.1 glycosyltransferase [Gordonia hankookensis]
MWETAVRSGSGIAVAALLQTLHNASVIRRPVSGAVPRTEALTVLIPMRDEIRHVAGCMAAVLDACDAWPGRARVVVLDDDSTDGTSEALADIAVRDHRVRVVAGEPIPPGWLGKTWACHQLSRLGADDDGGVLIFLDADVRVEPDAFAASVALLRETGLQLVSPYPRQQTHGPVERLVQPLLQWSWMSTLPLRLAERSARPSLSAANGQLLVCDADAYRRAGGHASVRAEILEDIALLRAVKRSGGHGVVVEGSAVASCAMYNGWRQVRNGYRKSLWSAFGSLPGTIAVVALLNVAYVVPAVAMLRGSRVGLIGYLAGVASRVIVARTTAGRVWPDVLAHPLSILAFTALTADSVVAHRRGSLTWRGRSVAVRR